MRLVVRQKGSRRMGLPVSFPLTDSDGIAVAHDRPQVPARRKPTHDLDDLKVILSKMRND